MSRLFECTVIEPPTGGEVYSLAVADMKSSEFELVLQPDTEVPRLPELALQFRFAGLLRDEVEYEAVLNARVLDPNSKFVSAVIRVPYDHDQPATATLVEY